MRLLSVSLVLFSAASLLQPSSAIRAVASGPCAGLCGNVSSTQASDIVCTDSDYQNTQTGQIFEGCINCQMNSTAVDPVTGDTDLKWLLYNLRFAMSTCLWGFPNSSMVQDTPCVTSRACGPWQNVIQYHQLSTNVSTYDYCSNYSSYLITQCSGCLQALNTDTYMANFFAALSTGCTFQLGTLIPLAGTLFSSSPVTLATPKPTSGSYSSGPSGPLSLGAKCGIAAGAIVFLLIITGITIIWCGKRRRRAKLAEYVRRQEEQRGFGGRVVPMASNIDTAWSPHPGYGSSQDESPATAGGYGSDKHGFSPYSSKYSSPVSARDALAPNNLWDIHQPIMNISPVDDKSRTKHEEYEMERMRHYREQEQNVIDQERLHEAWVNEAAQRGFTTAPIIKLPEKPGATHK